MTSTGDRGTHPAPATTLSGPALFGVEPDPADAAGAQPVVPVRERPRRKRHVILTAATLGVWVVVGPTVHWIRRRSYATATAWTVAWACVLGIAIVVGGSGAGDAVVRTHERPAAFPFLSPMSGGDHDGQGSDDDRAAPAPTASGTPTGIPTITPTGTLTGSPTGTSSPGHETSSASARTGAAATAPRRTGSTASSRPRTSATTRATAAPTGSTRPASDTPTATSAPAPQLDPRYRTCKAALAHGYGPYRLGVDPEYAWYPDPDHDGWACESKSHDDSGT